MHMVMALCQELGQTEILPGCIGMALRQELEIVSAMAWAARWLDANGDGCIESPIRTYISVRKVNDIVLILK